MATTAYSSTGAILSTSGYTFGIDGAVNYDSISRSNNTITVNGANSHCKITGPSGGWFTGWTVKTAYQFPTGTTRRTQDLGSGRFDVGDDLGSSENNFSFSVGANDTSVSVRAGGAYGSDGISWQSSKSFSIPALGSPAGTTTVNDSTETDTTIQVNNNVTTWGSNATAGSVRSYRADNSGFSGQTYISTTDNATVTHTGLTPNKRYWFRGWCDNGGGKSAYMSTDQGVTLARATINTTNFQATTAQFIGTATTGEYTPSTIIQYRVIGDTIWQESEAVVGGAFDITVEGLLPSTNYEYRYAVTTTAGTKYDATTPFNSQPAGKLVYPDGSVLSGVPRAVFPDGTVKLLKVNRVEPA